MALTFREARLLRQRWQRSAGQCMRCFHATRDQRADAHVTPATTTHNSEIAQSSPSAEAGTPTQQQNHTATIEAPSERQVIQHAESGSSAQPFVSPSILLPSTPRSQDNSRAYRPQKYTKQDLLTHGHNTASIAAKNYTGIIVDRLSTIVDTSQLETERSDRIILNRLKNGETVRFASKQQKDQLLENYPEDLPRGFQPNPLGRMMGKSQRAEINKKPYLKNRVRNTFASRLVGGQYQKPIESTATDIRGKTLAAMENLTRLNGTYHDKDVDKLVGFVKKLLPAATPAKAAGKAPAITKPASSKPSSQAVKA